MQVVIIEAYPTNCSNFSERKGPEVRQNWRGLGGRIDKLMFLQGLQTLSVISNFDFRGRKL